MDISTLVSLESIGLIATNQYHIYKNERFLLEDYSLEINYY